jgi:hypothetical protein
MKEAHHADCVERVQAVEVDTAICTCAIFVAEDAERILAACRSWLTGK